jgi:hypothetical protein
MPTPHIVPCPGLVGAIFTDALGAAHDLTREKTLRPKEAAADPRLGGISAKSVRQMITRGELYPVLRRNARMIEVCDCALTDWRARACTAGHLFNRRATRVA